MNKELIKTYKAEFDYWLDGGEVLFFYCEDWYSSTYNPEMVFNHSRPDDVKYYVINDEFVEIRKALAEGKTIQYNPLYASTNRWDDIKKFKPTRDCTVANYRIKPEKPKFKVGDWVVNKTSKQRIVKKVTSTYSDTVTVGDSEVGINVMLINDLELWQPKPGEWCWFWDIDSNPTLCQYSKYINGEYEALTINPKYKLQGLFGFCEPFIGIVPTNMKDNKCLH